MSSLSDTLATFSIPLWSRQTAQNIDQLSIETYGLRSLDLMERAASAIVNAYLARSQPNDRILIVAGPGNNGGDALAVARQLHQLDRTVDVFLVGCKGDRCSKEQRYQQDELRQLGVELLEYSPGSLTHKASSQLVIFDGLLGLGFRGSLREGLVKDCLQELAKLQRRLVVAIDLPSGMSADNTEGHGPLPADLTVTFGAPKLVHIAYPAKASCGEILSCDIHFAHQAINALTDAANYEEQERFVRPGLLEALRPWDHLPTNAHKYDRGHVLVIGGGPNTPGAPLLCAQAALKAGAGWVSVASPKPRDDQIHPSLDACLTSCDLFRDGKLHADELSTFVTQRNVKALVIGPGMTSQALHPELIEALMALSETQDCRLVLDASALEGLGSLLQAHQRRFAAEKILCTPHPGEWQKMWRPDHGPLPITQQVKTLRSMVCDDYGLSVVYKSASPFFLGPKSCIPWPRLWMQGELNALARAGSGDVLAGIAGAFSCLKLPAPIVGLLSYELLVQTAKTSIKRVGHHSVTAHELTNALGAFL